MIVLANTYIINFLQTVENLNSKLFGYLCTGLIQIAVFIALKLFNTIFIFVTNEIPELVTKWIIWIVLAFTIKFNSEYLQTMNLYSIFDMMMVIWYFHIALVTMVGLGYILALQSTIIRNLINVETYIKYCNFMKKKHIDLTIYPLGSENDITNFNKTEFYDGVKCLSIAVENEASEFVDKIIFPDTIEELQILTELNHFKSYIFNENIKTIGYDNYYTNTFNIHNTYNTMNNLHIQTYVALRSYGPKIDKTPYGCRSVYYDDYYDDNRYN